MRVMLVYPKPNISFDTTHCIPLGLASMAAVLEQEGHKVRCVDLNVQDVCVEKEVSNYDVVGLYVITPAFKSAVSLAEKIRHCTNALIVFGGPFPTAMTEECISKPFVDVVVIGEGEYTVRDLCDAVGKNRSLDSVNGICFKKDGKIVKTSAREKIAVLDELPFPAYHLFPFEKYLPTRPTWIDSRRMVPGSLITSRGCPFECLFCFSRRTGFRSMSPERVVADIQRLAGEFGVNFVEFQDDVFNLIPERSIEICRLLQKENVDIQWSIPNGLSRVENITRNFLETAKNSGCADVWFACESGSDRIRNEIIVKKNTVQQVRDAVRTAKDVGFDVGGFFVLGNPTETREEMQLTVDFACSMDLDRAQFTIATPFPGTALFELIKNAGDKGHFLINDFDFYGPYENKVFFEYGPTTKLVVEEMYKRAYRQFYLRPRYMAKVLQRKETFTNAGLLLKEAVRFII